MKETVYFVLCDKKREIFGIWTVPLLSNNATQLIFPLITARSSGVCPQLSTTLIFIFGWCNKNSKILKFVSSSSSNLCRFFNNSTIRWRLLLTERRECVCISSMRVNLVDTGMWTVETKRTNIMQSSKSYKQNHKFSSEILELKQKDRNS